MECRIGDAKLIGPLDKRHGSPLARDNLRDPPIACLLRWRCPATILFRVALVIVDPVERLALRPLAHILKEGCELLPARVVSDPPINVVRRALTAGVVAAGLHRRPRAIGRTGPTLA